MQSAIFFAIFSAQINASGVASNLALAPYQLRDHSIPKQSAFYCAFGEGPTLIGSCRFDYKTHYYIVHYTPNSNVTVRICGFKTHALDSLPADMRAHVVWDCKR
jgi:hypothetical protein